MSIYRKIYATVTEDYTVTAKRLFSEGKYKECIKYLDATKDSDITLGKFLLDSIFEPKMILIEDNWLQANCYYHLEQYNACLEKLSRIINHPSNSSNVKRYKDLASNMQSVVLNEMESLSELDIMYPVNTFTELFTDVECVSPEDIFKIEYEGLEKRDLEFYIKASSIVANSNIRFTIYIAPVSEKEVVIFGYIAKLKELKQMKDDDPIKYHTTVKKLPILQDLIHKGKDGAIKECTVFERIDWANFERTPVIGLKCSAEIKGHNIEELFNVGVSNVVKTANIIINEIQVNKLTTSDKLLMYGKAFTIGALSTVISKELGRDFAKAFKEVSNAVFRKS